ncbi:hypothetical protein GCM10009116_20750 [Brevundimonas basaltis]|uniref:Uncharacterized protein n=1 Tax=Brevundimonas basaltis TaxID=472166 RepID=A0A7W8MGD9_9CAUL|nr:hypothetical protein [Brevundimonas basaltis]MBB5291825.1 hypothetical protein [Brevundimonas basaltis]
MSILDDRTSKGFGANRPMRRGPVFALALAAALGLAAAPAAADEYFVLFRAMCLDTDADAARAEAVADAAGWGEIPPERLQELADSTSVVGARGRIGATPAGILVLMTGLSADSDAAFATEVCNLFGFRQTPTRDASPEIEQWVGLPPQRVEGASRMWSWEVRNGRKVAREPDAPTAASYAIVTTSKPTSFRYELARTRPAN